MSKELKQAIKVIGNTRLHTYDGIGNIQTKTISESNEFKVIVKAINELKEIKRQLPNLLQTAIQCGYGVKHTDDVELQEKQIINELLSKVGKEE